ncbi:energy-coupling factor ABC transporter substrate-binding protein [Trichothermofontia sichuanensis B231]|uniref:energy-coupling factor ABC transporter substrate-binding protein n=1 Tax=Trichothermofontia sichuanensis TaxID=3045816 RepID=UPI00224622DC|nr:energy-coupling factor ABC transporter substrate-binding protein [Trichothermofontia sichuanensis B231]
MKETEPRQDGSPRKVVLTQPTAGNGWLLLAVIALTIFPLLFVGGEYGGADGEAEAAIATLAPDYEPWFNPIWQPVSGEVESLLFVAQAAMGAGIVGYVIGLYQGRSVSGLATRRERGDDGGGQPPAQRNQG